MFLNNKTLERKLEAQVVGKMNKELKKFTFTNVYACLFKAIAPLLACRYEK